MDQDEQGLAALVADEAGAPQPEQPQEKQTEQTQTQEEPAPAPSAAEPEAPSEPAEPETPAPSQSSQEQNTNTETQTPPPIDWTQFVPSLQTEVAPPKEDENGNVDRDDLVRYAVERAKLEMRSESAQLQSLNKSLDQAETVLPEMKSNPKIAELVRNNAFANLQQGHAPDFVSAAQAIKEIMGSVKAEATTNATTHITTQQNAAIGGGSSTRPSEPNKGQQIADRINNNDPDAFVELLDIWQKEGIV